MSTEIELIAQLKNIDDSINRLSTCFHADFDGVTIHQTLEEIKVINNNISEVLERIASALEKQVANSTMINAQIMGKINETN